ncbi:hypothetical protein [Paraburkholderia youngii]|uniref:hypothetical protein n=1 Tax=Paraburkholderia youngii TaxID=2782701 RepID=UPI003D1EE635
MALAQRPFSRAWEPEPKTNPCRAHALRAASVRIVSGGDMTLKEKPAGTNGGSTSEHAPAHFARRFATAQALERYCESRIEREVERCRACMSEADWAEHRAWIEANARVSLLEALRARADRGEL